MRKKNKLIDVENAIKYNVYNNLEIVFLSGASKGLPTDLTICEIWDVDREDMVAYGISVLHPYDKFDELTGCKNALKKALAEINHMLDATGRRTIYKKLFDIFGKNYTLNTDSY